jgi:hypothetical protein
MNPTYHQFFGNALVSLRPGAIWSLDGDTYDGLKWLEKPVSKGGKRKPTEEEVQAEVERLQAEYEYNQYQRDRATAYPSIQNQLDTLYHQGYDGWKESINKVKEEYPKPE